MKNQPLPETKPIITSEVTAQAYKRRRDIDKKLDILGSAKTVNIQTLIWKGVVHFAWLIDQINLKVDFAMLFSSTMTSPMRELPNLKRRI